MKPLATVGPPMMVPRAPVGCVPKSVPEVDGVLRTLSGPEDILIRSPLLNPAGAVRVVALAAVEGAEVLVAASTALTVYE